LFEIPRRMKHDAWVDPGWIAEHLDDPAVRVVEVDVSAAAYDAGHIPSAVLWDAYKDLRHPDYTPVDSEQLDAVLGRSGITPDTTVVFYGYAPYLGYWLLSRDGHKQVRVLDGPRERWEAAGNAWSTDAPEPSMGSYARGREQPRLTVSRKELEEAIGDAESVILDVRSREEFSGERFWPSGATEDVGRAGHVPGAVHVPVDVVRTDGATAADSEELRGTYLDAGVVPERRVIAYCTIGNRASQVAFVLKHILGYPDVAVYYGSWSEWGSLPDTPVET
jgi:thiosulfate/3-mercaptopyruvate sulfurtransferase